GVEDSARRPWTGVGGGAPTGRHAHDRAADRKCRCRVHGRVHDACRRRLCDTSACDRNHATRRTVHARKDAQRCGVARRRSPCRRGRCGRDHPILVRARRKALRVAQVPAPGRWRDLAGARTAITGTRHRRRARAQVPGTILSRGPAMHMIERTAACHVAIVGAGPAGAATAIWLARAGCRVTLLERSRFDGLRIGESLAPGVQPLLVQLGVWPQFLALGPLPSYGTRSAWGGSAPHEHSHMVSPYANGWHVDRQAFDRMLANYAVDAGALLALGARVVGCEPVANGRTLLRVAGERGTRELRADLVIDAGGRGSPVSHWLGARRVILDRLVAVAAHFAD